MDSDPAFTRVAVWLASGPSPSLDSSFLLAEMGGGRPDTPTFKFAEAGVQQLPCAAPFEVRGRHPVVEIDNAINRLSETENAGTQFSRWIFIYTEKSLQRQGALARVGVLSY